MADVKQILVVDDHFEMLDFLRSMLETSNQDHQVLAVPSAEEGLMELKRTQFDLLITDVRLPGMSGFDLVRQVRRLQRDMPVIMITAYSSAEGQKEAADLGVLRYFRKPLDTDNVLTAVHKALYGEVVEPAIESEISSVSAAAEIDWEISDEVRRRLRTLRTDTRAVRLMLSSVSGEVLFETGSGSPIDLPQIASIIARNVGNNLLLAAQLGSDDPFTMLYQTAGTLELYSATVGRFFLVTLFFDIESRRGRIGTVWVFVQRAIKDLLTILPVSQAEEAPVIQAAIPPVTPEAPSPPPELPPVEETPAAEPEPLPQAQAKPEPKPEPLSEEEKAKLEELFAGAESSNEKAELDLDSFWEDALTQKESDSTTLTLEEARRKGLIPTEFEDKQQPEE